MNNESKYKVLQGNTGLPVKAWVQGVPFEDEAQAQLLRVASLPFIHKWVAAMPDVHLGIGATVGSVIATTTAIIPAAVGVDIGCGMLAARSCVNVSELPDGLAGLRAAIEKAVPHGRTDNGGKHDRGAWHNPPSQVVEAWNRLEPRYASIVEKYPRIDRGPTIAHLGTLGTGNHFIEICLDETDQVWIMLHSGSRGPGNRVGSDFVALAKNEMKKWHINLPDLDLAYLPEGSPLFGHYLQAVTWAQDFAAESRLLMLRAVVTAIGSIVPGFSIDEQIVHCHHNYVAKEHHFGKDVWVTRKGAVRAAQGDLGIIPGSMGARSFIVIGKGQPESFNSCSHGAGRSMSRTAARKAFTIEDHKAATMGIECRKDAEVLDETPGAYKSIDAVMQAQSDLVDVVHTLRQIICVKG